MPAMTCEVEIWSETQTELYYVETDPALASHFHEKPRGTGFTEARSIVGPCEGP